MKSVDIEDDGIHRYVVLGIKPFAVLKKEFPVEKTGKRIAFGFMDYDAALGKLDRMADSGPDHIRSVIRLRDEIGSAELKALDLSALFGRQDDNGYAP